MNEKQLNKQISLSFSMSTDMKNVTPLTYIDSWEGQEKSLSYIPLICPNCRKVSTQAIRQYLSSTEGRSIHDLGKVTFSEPYSVHFWYQLQRYKTAHWKTSFIYYNLTNSLPHTQMNTMSLPSFIPPTDCKFVNY